MQEASRKAWGYVRWTPSHQAHKVSSEPVEHPFTAVPSLLLCIWQSVCDLHVQYLKLLWLHCCIVVTSLPVQPYLRICGHCSRVDADAASRGADASSSLLQNALGGISSSGGAGASGGGSIGLSGLGSDDLAALLLQAASSSQAPTTNPSAGGALAVDVGDGVGMPPAVAVQRTAQALAEVAGSLPGGGGRIAVAGARG
jgi:hypothetical protein